jgi:ATP-dependent DNA helicase DinG
MKWVHDRVSQQVGYYCYLQGTASKQRLLQAFTADTTSCLFATKSFFEGIDIPGESLSCVVLCKAPFPVPTDPLHQAQSDKLEEQGLDPFALLSMPQMLFELRQAFGRLIRTTSDTGTFACLDSRATWRKGYSVRVRGVLPQSRVIVKLGQEPGQVDTETERVAPAPRRSRAALLLEQEDD